MIKLPEKDEVFVKKNNVLDWGKEEFAIVKPHLTSFRTCLDIGAHVGITSIRYAKYFNNVHSFEPVHYNLLKENTKDLNNVICHNTAVSDTKQTVKMYPGTYNSGVGVIPHQHNKEWIDKRFNNEKSRYKDVEMIDVNCEVIDDLELNDVDFIKIDVEGYNIPVITGMMKTLQKTHPIIQLEMAFESVVNKQVSDMLTSLGYTVFYRYERDNFYKVS